MSNGKRRGRTLRAVSRRRQVFFASLRRDTERASLAQDRRASRGRHATDAKDVVAPRDTVGLTAG